MKLHVSRLLVLSPVLALAGCASAYFGALERVGIEKRELLVSRVEGAREAQGEARAQFADALEAFLAVTGVQPGEIARQYERMKDELAASESRARAVRERIAGVESVARELFREWERELGQYSNPTLRAQSERQLAETRRRYDALAAAMNRAADRMEPVLATFRDQVLFLKHNLNAQAVAGLAPVLRGLETDIDRLVADLEASIREADAFLGAMER